MTKPEKERRTGENLGVQPKKLTLWEARQAVWKDRFAGLFMVRLFFCVAAFGGWMLKTGEGKNVKRRDVPSQFRKKLSQYLSHIEKKDEERYD